MNRSVSVCVCVCLCVCLSVSGCVYLLDEETREFSVFRGCCVNSAKKKRKRRRKRNVLWAAGSFVLYVLEQIMGLFYM